MTDQETSRPFVSFDLMRHDPAFIFGWSDASRGIEPRPFGPQAEMYMEGYRECQRTAGVPIEEAASPVPVEPAYDAVKIPSHYNQGKIEVANFIADQGLDYVRGNVVKYVSRAGKKDPSKELEDLEKAAAYLQMAYNTAKGLPAVVRDPETKEVVWSLFRS